MLASVLILAGHNLTDAAAAAPAVGAALTLPSGEAVTLQEVVRDQGEGTTWRYRFVMPSLAARVPALPEGGQDDEITPEDAAELDRLGLPSSDGPFEAHDFNSAEMVTLEELEAEGAIDNRIFIDLGGDEASDRVRVPAEPGVLLQDAAHADLLWLCETVALPDLPPVGDATRPGMIVISVADRPVAFGEMAMDVVQHFEGFSPSDDNRTCLWEPW